MKGVHKFLLITLGMLCIPFTGSAQTLQSYSYSNAATSTATIQLNAGRNPVYLHYNCDTKPITINSVKVFGVGNSGVAPYTRARIGNITSDTVVLSNYTAHRAATSTYTFSTPVDCPNGEIAIAFEGANATSGALIGYYLGKSATSTTDGTGWCSGWDIGTGGYSSNSSCQFLNNAWNYEIWGSEYTAPVPDTGGTASSTDLSKIEAGMQSFLWLIAFIAGFILFVQYLRS